MMSVCVYIRVDFSTKGGTYMACSNHPNRGEIASIRSAVGKSKGTSWNRGRRDFVPGYNPNPDADSIRDPQTGEVIFKSGVWFGQRPGEVGKVLMSKDDPVSIHIHKHPDGITMTKYENGKKVEQFDWKTRK